jgi:hypothetical protein
MDLFTVTHVWGLPLEVSRFYLAIDVVEKGRV